MTTLADLGIQLRAAALRIEQTYGAAVGRRWEPVSDAAALALPPKQFHLRHHPMLPTNILLPQPTCMARYSKIGALLPKWLRVLCASVS